MRVVVFWMQLLVMMMMMIIIMSIIVVARARAAKTNKLTNIASSRSALVNINVEDDNEFSPEFERHLYVGALSWPPEQQQQQQDWTHLIDVRATDRDCSSELGSVCGYELLADSARKGLSSSSSSGNGGDVRQFPLAALQIDSSGRIRVHERRLHALLQREQRQSGANINIDDDADDDRMATAASASTLESHKNERHSHNYDAQDMLQDDDERPAALGFAVIAYDCAGKKSLQPASVRISLNKMCQPAWRGEYCTCSELFERVCVHARAPAQLVARRRRFSAH